MAGNHEFQEYKTPGQVAKIIGVSVPTLRKYSLMIEKATNNQYFERNQQNTRLYTEQNIERLKELTKLSKSPDRTLQDVIAQLYTITEPDTEQGPEATAQVHASVEKIQKQATGTDLAPVAQFMQVLTTMQDTVSQQKQTIDALQQQLQIVQEQNVAILERLNQNEGIDSFEEGIRLPNESKMHATEPSQPVPLAEPYKPQTADASLSEAQALENLDEAEEQAFKPRTLQDMQVEPEGKKHWWQRFFNN